MSPLLFSLTTVGPVFLIIAIGVVLRRAGLINPDIAGDMSRLVFHLFLPALLLKALIVADFGSLLSWRLLLTVWGILFMSFAVSRLLSGFIGVEKEDRGLFASGSTWGNVAIVGYALGEALYGEEGLARAAVFSAMVLPLHTPMGLMVMDRTLTAGGRRGFVPAMFRRIVTNPILMSIVIGLTLNLGLGVFSLQVPGFIMNILDILARASLPLALVAIGGSLEFGRQGAGWTLPGSAVAVKLLMMPLIAFAVTGLVGLSPGWRGSVIIGFSCPTAVSFFVISRSLGYEGAKGAAIVTATTVGAAVTIGVLAVVLKAMGLA